MTTNITTLPGADHMDAIRGAYQMMCRAMNGGYAGMADALGTSPASLNNSVYGRKGQQMTVKRAMAMQSASQTSYFAEAVARASAGVFVPLPEFGELGNVDIQEKYLELLEQVGAHAREYRGAIEDNKISRRERRDLENLANNICQLVTQINQLTFRIFAQEE